MKLIIFLSNVLVWLVLVLVTTWLIPDALTQLNEYNTRAVVRGLIILFVLFSLWLVTFSLTLHNIRKDSSR